MCAAVMMQDDDPYVRKTAAVCVAKLYDISAELVEDRGFLDMLRVRHISMSAVQGRAWWAGQQEGACPTRC